MECNGKKKGIIGFSYFKAQKISCFHAITNKEPMVLQVVVSIFQKFNNCVHKLDLVL